MLGFRQEHSSSYYPQANGQVEAVNKTLKTILKRTIDVAVLTGISCYTLLFGRIELM